VRGQQASTNGQIIQIPGHIIDLMPTLLAVSGGQYPTERSGVKFQPMEGCSLLPAFENKPITRAAPLFFEHEGSRAVRDGKWKLVSVSGDAWELYDLDADPTELNNLIAKDPAKALELSAAWDAWAKRCHVEVTRAVATPPIAHRPLRISCDVQAESREGVILAQGGRQHGYALHLRDGRPVFSVRIAGEVFAIQAAEAPAGRFSLVATLAKDGAMRLSVNGRDVARGKASGWIPVQPQDELSLGEDAHTAVGNYAAPHPLKGTVENIRIASPDPQ
jgi:arylsulfatase